MKTKRTMYTVQKGKRPIASSRYRNTNAKGLFSLKTPGGFGIVLGILIVLMGGLLFYQQASKHRTHVVTLKTQVLVRRSMNLNQIKRSLTGKAIDVNTGKVLKAARVFSSHDDRTVYMELDLQNNKKGLIIDYIRYKEGRFVDHGEIILGKDNIQTVLFNWTINNVVSKLTEGKWKVATYTNGVLANRVLYTVTSTGQLGYVVSQDVMSSDPDYNLSTALGSQKH